MRPKAQFLTLYKQSLTINIQTSIPIFLSQRKFSQSKAISFTRTAASTYRTTLFLTAARNIASHSNTPPKIRRNIAMKHIHAVNLPDDITKQDICEIFGSNSTFFLRDACNIDFSIHNRLCFHKGSSTYYR